MTELSAGTLAVLQTAASTGLVVCLLMAGAFTALGFAVDSERDRRQDATDHEQVADVGDLLAERDDPASWADDEPTPPGLDEEDPFDASVADAVAARPEPVPTAEDRPEVPDAASQSEEAVPPVASSEPVPEPGQAPSSASGDDLPSGLGALGPLPEAPPEARAMLSSPPPRRIDRSEAALIVAALEEEAGTFSVEVTSAPEAEPRLYALQIVGALREAGIDARGPVPVLSTGPSEGLIVSGADGTGPGSLLLSALQGAGLAAYPAASGRSGDAVTPEDTDVRLYVGAGPRPSLPEPDQEPQRAASLEDA